MSSFFEYKYIDLLCASYSRLTPVLRTPTLYFMEVRLTPDQEAFIRQAIETGRFSRAEDAIEEALSLWEEHERARAEILAAVDTAEASLSRGEGRPITPQSMRELANEVQQRGRARFEPEQRSRR
jgi:putative addiction module CopG family antidote